MKNFFNNSTIHNIAQVMPCRYDCSNVWIVPKGNETINNNAFHGLVLIPDFIKILVIVRTVLWITLIFSARHCLQPQMNIEENGNATGFYDDVILIGQGLMKDFWTRIKYLLCCRCGWFLAGDVRMIEEVFKDRFLIKFQKKLNY